ncbi:MAG: WhiB family transcriptional regulator [Acidimicrobiales bacterium]
MSEDHDLPDGFTLPADTTSSGPRSVLRRTVDEGTCPDVSTLGRRPAWQRRAACRGKGCAQWFPTSREAEDAARAVCEPCVVRRECLSYALGDKTIVGIWAGTDTAERRRMRKVSA